MSLAGLGHAQGLLRRAVDTTRRSWHPSRPVHVVLDFLAQWLADATTFGDPFRITLRQLMNATELAVEPALVRVCENPAVLLEAANRLGEGAAPLVCTEGQPSEACRLLRTP